ncbi:hypothetical protein K435DRAFT_866196 [Dendrothele bispora CBS 962.96]|uniref:Uncharacterized protein n=1 Tax=Dendrothele bispora (strain CBS 962.96) TaxID=1314807 RepID=A0A4S8LHP0_DENBC|nr:hypothetical protein K435DRAFT_866196 [Dendrothele bispora CBS 962.96]
MSPPSEKSFIAISPLPSLLTTFLGSRYKYDMLAFAGVTGGVVFSLAISVIIHPSLFTQIVLTSVIAPILTHLVCLPLESAISPYTSLGKCLVEVLVSEAEFGVGRKQKNVGLDAGFRLFLLVGIANSDTYLANHTSNLPNRAGMFKSSDSFRDRWFPSKSARNSTNDEAMIFPEDPKHPVNPPKSSPLKQLPPHLLSHSYPVNTRLEIHSGSLETLLIRERNWEWERFRP